MRQLQHPLAQLFLTSAVAGLILTVLAPLGTMSLAFPARVLFWVGLCFAGGIGAGLAAWVLERANKTPSHVLFALTQSVGASLCVAPFVLVLMRPENVKNLSLILFYVWFISIVISSVGALLRRSQEQKNAAVDGTQAQMRAKLYDRLAPKFRSAEIYAITAEDHYVRVYTSIGEEMILMRLSDAIAETAPLRGVQTHRSWWVAEGGVESARRKDGKIILTLKNKSVAPVSRNGAKAVKEAGWL